MAKMGQYRSGRRHLAIHIEDERDLSHEEWRTKPNYKNPETRTDLTPNMKAQVVHQWHPYYGESHIQYEITPEQSHDGSGDATGKWNVSHNGLCLGMKTVTDQAGNTWTHNNYDWREGEHLGKFDSVDEAKVIAQLYHQHRYAQQPRPDLGDLNTLKDQYGEGDQQGHNNFDDYDYGDIFGGH